MKFPIRTKNEVVAVVFVLGLAACSGSDSGGVYQGGSGKGGRSGAGGSSNPNCASKTTCFERCMCEGGGSANAQVCVTTCNSSSGGAGGGTGQCGNGRIEGTEQCDGADLRGETCQRVTMNARPTGVLACTPTCTFDLAGCTGGAGGAGGMGGLGGAGGAGGLGGGGGAGGMAP